MKYTKLEITIKIIEAKPVFHHYNLCGFLGDVPCLAVKVRFSKTLFTSTSSKIKRELPSSAVKLQDNSHLTGQKLYLA